MQLAELSRKIENLIRIGTIIEVDATQARCRLESGGLKTNWLAWVSLRAGNSKTWDPPSIGEQALIFSPSGEVANGIALLGIYSDTNSAPRNNQNLINRTYPDGAVIEYNHATSHLTLIGIKSMTIQAADSISINCPEVIVNGQITAEEMLANGISLTNHQHPGDSGGNTGAPLS